MVSVPSNNNNNIDHSPFNVCCVLSEIHCVCFDTACFNSSHSSGARRGTYTAPSGASRRRGPRSTGQGASGHSANSGDSLADEDEDA